MQNSSKNPTKKELNKARNAIGLPDLEKQERLCLRCDRLFLSEGKWNRRCDRCKNSDKNINNYVKVKDK